jgi:hypothetical protein
MEVLTIGDLIVWPLACSADGAGAWATGIGLACWKHGGWMALGPPSE